MDKRGYKHGLRYTLEYRTWRNIKQRCYNKNHPNYADYGGRGIQMSDEWVNDPVKFCEDMGTKPTNKHTIERIDNNGNYCKENCKWDTRKTQANNRRSNHLLTYNGKTQNIEQWSKETGLTKLVICNRLNANWDIEKVLTYPVQPTRPKKH